MAEQDANPAGGAAGGGAGLLPGVACTLIVGTGLLGASLGLAMKAAGYRGRVVGLNRSRASGEAALARGAVDELADGYGAAADAGLVVVGVPLSAFGGVFTSLAPHLRADVVVTDLGSTKRSVQAAAEAGLRDASRFVGGHPMAGSERAGAAHADAGLFAGKPCVLCPGEASAADAVAVVEALWWGVGMTTMRMTADEHDRHVAYTSHLPHALAVALVEAVASGPGAATASSGYRDATRLAVSNPPMRADIMHANADALAAAIDDLTARLATLRGTLQDREALRLRLADAAQTRSDWSPPAV